METENNWNFNEPYLWSKDFTECSSTEQSPINIDTENLTQCKLLCQLDTNIKSYHKAHHNIEEIVPWSKSRRTKNYYRYIYSEQHHIQMTTHFVKYVDLYLREKQIKTFFQFSCEDNYFNPLFIPIDFSKIRSKHPFALDDGHPGVGAHQELADILYQHVLSKELDN